LPLDSSSFVRPVDSSSRRKRSLIEFVGRVDTDSTISIGSHVAGVEGVGQGQAQGTKNVENPVENPRQQPTLQLATPIPRTSLYTPSCRPALDTTSSRPVLSPL